MSCESVKEVNFRSNTIMAWSYGNMNNMRKKQILCDMSIIIGNKILSAHKIILASNSKYFDMMFTGGFKESNLEEITLNEIDPDAVEQLINYMYTSQLKITEDNVQNIFVASNFLLIEDVDIECVKFMKENINIKNCLEYKHFADSNNVVELYDSCFLFILDHFSIVTNSSDFLLEPVEFILELSESNLLNVKEEKIYEFIISWVKYELKSRQEFLPKLMTSLNMFLISVTYFISNIENREIVKSNCSSFLYETLKMMLVKREMGISYQVQFNQHLNRRNRNQLIFISSWKKGENNLEWMYTENKIKKTTEIKWTSFNSIILRNGRIFRLSYCPDNNWSGRIYIENQWKFIGNFKFNRGSKEMLRLIELSDCVYVMSHLGYFKCFNMKKNTWEELQGISIDRRDSLRGLTICNGILYCICVTSVHRFNIDTKSWSMISKNRQEHRIDYTTLCSLNGCLYEIGGMRYQDGTYLKSAMKFDLSSNTWCEIADMNTARKNAGVVAVNGLIYVFGGENCDDSEMYDPDKNEWEKLDCKLKSNDHYITRAFLLDPQLNIEPDDFLKDYPIQCLD